MDIIKRKADITYDIGNYSIERIENISDTGSPVYTNATDLLHVFARILPRYGTPLPTPLPEVTLENVLYVKMQNYLMDGRLFTFAYIEALLMPWLVQQSAILEMKWADVPAENVVTGWYCEKTYKLSVAPASFYAFALICLSIICWSLALTVPGIFIRLPTLSRFRDVDFLSKLLNLGKIAELGSDATSSKIERELDGVIINVEEVTAPQGSGNREEYAMESVTNNTAAPTMGPRWRLPRTHNAALARALQ